MITYSNCNIGGANIDKDQIIIDDKKYTIPGGVKNMSISMINNKVFINGYELKNGKWVRTLRALWHKWF